MTTIPQPVGRMRSTWTLLPLVADLPGFCRELKAKHTERWLPAN